MVSPTKLTERTIQHAVAATLHKHHAVRTGDQLTVGERFDPYPYILLNLMLSMVAGLQGAILLIAAKRSDRAPHRLDSRSAAADHSAVTPRPI